MEQVVKTYDGTTALKSKCRKIQGEYYETSRQCFRMSDGKWHRITNGKVVFLYDLDKWVLKGDYDYHPTLVAVSSNGDFKLENCSTNSVSGITLRDITNGSMIPLYKEELLETLMETGNVREELSTGLFIFKPTAFTDREIQHLNKKAIRNYRRRLEYRAQYSLNDSIKKYKKGAGTETPINNSLAEELGGTTFGIEFETWNGTISERKLDYFGLIPLKDGSLRKEGGEMAYEYTTVPLKGAVGLKSLRNIADCLSKYTEIAPNCSTHIHLGGYELSKGFIVALYGLVSAIEKEIFSLFPAYFENTGKFKRQSYCGPMYKVELHSKNSVDENFKNIFDLLSGNNDKYFSTPIKFEGFSSNGHPLDKTGEHKWNIPFRYTYCNLIPLIWGTSHTTEFRVHPPTINKARIVNWLFITNAIVQYAFSCRENPETILDDSKIGLHKILNTVYSGGLALHLIDYVEFLKKKRIKYDSVGDYTGIMWCKEDPTFEFSTPYLRTIQ